MTHQTATVFTSAIAAFFAYLSWRKAVLTDIYKREGQLRARLSDPGVMFETACFTIRAVRVRVRERSGYRYIVSKYNPLGDVQGQTQVTLEFPRGDGRVLFEHKGEREYFEDIGVYYLTDHEFSTDDENDDLVTMTLIIDTLDPDEVEHKLVVYKVALEGHYKHRLDGIQDREESE